MITINEQTDIEQFISENKGVRTEFSDLLNKTIYKIEQINDDIIVILTANGYMYALFHYQDCCESVYIEDICGDLNNSTGLVVRAEEVVNVSDNPTRDDSETWTFYKLDTVKDNVTIRFCGHSNGYYSEEVSVYKVFVPELNIMNKLLNF